MRQVRAARPARSYDGLPTRPALAVLVLSMALALTSCGDGDERPEPAPTATSSSTGASEPTASDPTESAPATVPPATGGRMRLDAGSMRAPQGWEVDDAFAPFLVTARIDEDRADSENLITFGDQAFPRPGAGVFQSWYDQTVISARGRGVRGIERLPDRLLGTAPAWHFVGRTPQGWRYEEIGTIFHERAVTVDFEIEPDVLAQEPDLVESVLATFTWK